MELNRTVIMPPADVALSTKLLTSLVFDEDVLVMLVFGRGAGVEEIVRRADRRAYAVVGGIQRKVGWILDPNPLAAVLQRIDPRKERFDASNLNDIAAIAVSLGNRVGDVVRAGETIDFARIELAFVRAGAA